MVEDTVNLPVFITVLSENVPQEHQLRMQAVFVAESCIAFLLDGWIHMGGFVVQSVAQRAGSPSNKQTVLSTLVHMARALCDEDSLRAELVFLRDIFRWNGYKDRQIHNVLNRPPNNSKLDNEPSSWDHIQSNQVGRSASQESL
jgi:hypothetical protein